MYFRILGLNYTKFKHLVIVTVLSVVGFANSVYPQTPSAAATRAIIVMTEPNATIWINGVRYGKTDETGKLEIKTVRSGAQPIRVRADGFAERTMAIPATRRGQIDIPLKITADRAELAFQEAERLTLIDRGRAAEGYRKAISLNPRYVNAHLGLARVLTEMGDFEEAADSIAAVRRLQPAMSEASAILARVQKESGSPEKALEFFRRAIKEGRGFQPESYTGIGLYYKDRAESSAARGDFEEESKHYAEAASNLRVALTQLSGAPDSMIIYQLLGLIYERQGKNKEAIATYEEFLRIFPNTIEATAVRSFIVQLRKNEN